MSQQLLVSNFKCDGTWRTLYEGVRSQVEVLDLSKHWKLIFSAYVLATVKHECANKWKPIKEYGYGLGHPYRPYFGRGLIQCTWRYNYKKYQDILKLPLVDNPDLLLRDDVSLFVLVHGMYYGVFTGKGFNDYTKPTENSFVDMRRIVNGTDRAQLIASYAHDFLEEIS